MYTLTICSTMVKTRFSSSERCLCIWQAFAGFCFQRRSRKIVWSKSQGNQTYHHLIQNGQKNYGVSNNHKFCWLVLGILYAFEIIMVMSILEIEYVAIHVYFFFFTACVNKINMTWKQWSGASTISAVMLSLTSQLSNFTELVIHTPTRSVHSLVYSDFFYT